MGYWSSSVRLRRANPQNAHACVSYRCCGSVGSTINVSEVMNLRKLAQARPTMPCIPLVSYQAWMPYIFCVYGPNIVVLGARCPQPSSSWSPPPKSWFGRHFGRHHHQTLFFSFFFFVQGLNAAATAGFEPRTVWSEVRRRNRVATAPQKRHARKREALAFPVVAIPTMWQVTSWASSRDAAELTWCSWSVWSFLRSHSQKACLSQSFSDQWF